jgi:inhibitor of KinA sporulation pathway (predicted exonuclease)
MDLDGIKYIAAIDLEMVCDDPPLPRDQMEIIEIGIAVLDIEILDLVNTVSKVVKPRNKPVLTEYCKNLTHITQEEVDKADDLSTTMLKIIGLLPNKKELIWCSWGNDPLWLEKELKAQGTVIDGLSFKFINLKLRDGKRRGLNKALKANNIIQQQPAHRALPDAISTALLAKKYKVRVEDVQVSNTKTYKQQITQQQKTAIEKFSTRYGISKEAAKFLLKNFDWNFCRAKYCIDLILKETKNGNKEA